MVYTKNEDIVSPGSQRDLAQPRLVGRRKNDAEEAEGCSGLPKEIGGQGHRGIPWGQVVAEVGWV